MQPTPLLLLRPLYYFRQTVLKYPLSAGIEDETLVLRLYSRENCNVMWKVFKC